MEHLRSFKPSLVIVSAGFDAYLHDPLAQETLEREDFHWLGASLRRLGVPIVSLLEGGYSEDLPDLILAYLTGAKLGSLDLSRYLLIPKVVGAQELSIVASAIMGGLSYDAATGTVKISYCSHAAKIKKSQGIIVNGSFYVPLRTVADARAFLVILIARASATVRSGT